jgi:hypothetical protein
MATTLSNWLIAGEAAPMAFEMKFPKAPKLTTVLNKIATTIPAGPAIYPNPPAGGLPTFDISKIPNPPNIFGTPTVTGSRLVTPVRPILPQRGNNPNVEFLQRKTQGRIGGTAVNYK